MTSLNRRMAKGASWLILFRLVERGIGFISTLILARLLVPADFGLVAMAMSILAFVGMLSAFSFDVALIQNAKAERRHYDTAWTFNVIVGIFNALVLVALALPAADFYNEPRVAGIMVALAAICAISGFSNIGVVAFQKDLNLHKEFVLGVTKKIIAFIVTISLAYMLASYWALIAGTMASAVVAVFMSYQMHPYRPRFDLQGRNELFHFSKWMLLNNLLVSLTHRVPDLVIGRLAGPSALGLYTVAYEISNLPTTELVFPIGRAVFPGYAKMASVDNELKFGFLNVLAVIMLVIVPAGLGIVALAKPFVYTLLGSKWSDAIPLVQVLGVYGVIRASGSNIGAVYLALGLPQLQTYQAMVFLAALFPSLWLLVNFYGVYGACYAVLLSAVIQVPFGFFVVMRKLKISVKAIASAMWRPVVAGLLMAGVLIAACSGWFFPSVFLEFGYLLQLLFFVPLGAIIYATVVFGLWFVVGQPDGGESKLLSAATLALEKMRNRRSMGI